MVRTVIKWLSRGLLIGLTGLVSVAVLDTNALGINDTLQRHPDKVSHAIFAFGFALTASIALPSLRVWKICASLALLALLAELGQIFGGRSAHISDLVTSWVGILAFAAAYWGSWLRGRKPD
jgi:VanZ family protein